MTVDVKLSGKPFKCSDEEAFSLCALLRESGYTVVIWTPEETKGVKDLSGLDDVITEFGNEAISDARTDPSFACGKAGTEPCKTCKDIWCSAFEGTNMEESK